ncbi:MAG: DNA mismatch repair protein MutS, partial [Rhodothermales bacterium]|nr:DNA mismatch repair protein MutS [Rhodothermales bacterium]
LNDLADRLPRVRNYRIQVQEHRGKVIFLRKLVPGGADHSYGIEVARMAGLPSELVERARSILAELESQHGGPGPSGSAPAPRAVDDPTLQMTLFQSDPGLAEIADKLRAIDPDRLTPIEALLMLAELKDKLR